VKPGPRATARNYGKVLTFERMTLFAGPNCPVPPVVADSGRAAYTALFHFSEWICISQNFNDRRARLG
jgi:hypothetical protein